MTQLRSPKRLPGDCPAIGRRLAGDRPAIFRPSVNAPLFAKARPLKYLEPLSPARGVTYIANDGSPVANLPDDYLSLGIGRLGPLGMPVLIFAGVALACWWVLRYTTYGRYLYAVGGNEKSARTSGIGVRKVVFSVYVVSGALAGLAGMILAARTTSALPQAGVSYELDAIAAVVIGGTSLSGGQGGVVGTLFGALLIGVINNGLNLLGVSSYYQQIAKGLIIVLAVLIDVARKQQR